MLVAYDKAFACDLLDIIQYNSRDYLLFGKRLIALIHTHNKSFRCTVLGGRIAMSE